MVPLKRERVLSESYYLFVIQIILGARSQSHKYVVNAAVIIYNAAIIRGIMVLMTALPVLKK